MDAKCAKATRQNSRRKQKIFIPLEISKDLMKFICVAAGLCHSPNNDIDLLMHERKWNRKQWKQQRNYFSKNGLNNVTKAFCCSIFHHQSEKKHYSCMKVQNSQWQNIIHGIPCCRDHKAIKFKTIHPISKGRTCFMRLLMPKGKSPDGCRIRMIRLLWFISRKYLGANDLLAFKSWLKLIYYFKAAKTNMFSLSNAQRMMRERYFLYMVIGCFQLIYHNLSNAIINNGYNNQINNNDNNLNCMTSEIKSKLKSKVLNQVTLEQFTSMFSRLDNSEILKKEDDIKNVSVEKYHYHDLLRGNYFQPAPQCLYVYPGINDPSITHNFGIRWKNFHQESYRLQTFLHFPQTFEVSPVILANEGFIHSPEDGFEDKVLCIFCLQSHTGWQNGDDITEIHKNISKDCPCPMAWGEECGNIPIRVNNRNVGSVNGSNITQPASQAGEWLNRPSSLQHNQLTTGDGLLRTTAAPTLLTPNGVESYNAGSRARDGSTQARSVDSSHAAQSSTQASSHSNRIFQLPLDLFEVTQGRTNVIKCFFCGRQHSISNNRSSIWIEHASLFPDCGYVRLVRGNSFVDAVLELLLNNNQVTEAMVSEQMNLPIALGAYASAPSRHQSSLENFRPQENLTDLMEEHERLRWRITCQKCLVNNIEVVMIPCGCLAICVECSMTLTSCYKCRHQINGFVRAFLS